MTIPDRFNVLNGILAFAVSAPLTGLIRYFLLRRRILDVPSERSSHSIPTPRGGGIAIAAVFLASVVLLALARAIPGNVASALLGGGLTVALAGIFDDVYHLSPPLRLVLYFSAAGWALWQLGGMAPLDLGRVVWNWGWAGNLAALVGLVWMIVMYNYMDGIDGLAGMEAVYAGAAGSLFLASAGLAGLSATAMALAGASAGFLIWNFPIARVFMGDTGSGFLGFVFGVLAVASAKQRPALLWLWLTLLAVFIVDATLTLARRLIGGANWRQPHRTSGYQQAAVRWGSHRKVTFAIAGLNILFVAPLAWAGFEWASLAPICFAIALTPLVGIAFLFDAGVDRSRSNGRVLSAK